MEGMHLDPGLYLYEFARYSQAHLNPKLSRQRSLRGQEAKSLIIYQGVASMSMSSIGPASDVADERREDDQRCAAVSLCVLQ